MNAYDRRTRRTVLALAGAVSLLLATTPGGAFRLEDSLRNGTRGNQVGGRLAADGWHVTDRRDRVWYALPRLVSGSVEFTLANVTRASLGETGDNELFAMYEGGYGITEPIRYAPEFRVNHYKCMLRVYANGEPGRPGQQKLMWGMCPSGSPGYGDCGCGSFFEEPFGGNGNWDGSPQRMRIEWGNGRTRYLRNGAVVVTIDWSRSGITFGPSSLHMSLGTSRPSGVGDAQLPVGAIFSDLVVEGVEGDLARCPGASMPDAGTPMVSGMVMDFPVVEDVTVAEGTTGVYPDPRDLSVGRADSEFYLKFRVGTLPGRVVQAQLLLNSATHSSARGSGASVFAATSTAWSEQTLTWSARPGPRGSRLGRVDGITVDQRYTLALPPSAVPTAGTYAFAVLPESSDTDSAHFDAKEVSPARGPVLRLVIDPSMPPLDAGTEPTPDVPATPTDRGAQGVDAGPTNDLGTPIDAATPRDTGAVAPDAGSPSDAGPTTPDTGASDDTGAALREAGNGGCHCHVGRHRTPSGGLVGAALLALAGVGLGRRRRP